MSVERQTHLVAGIIVWTAVVLAFTVGTAWLWLAALPGFGMLLDAITGVCPMTLILRKLPWNRMRVA